MKLYSLFTQDRESGQTLSKQSPEWEEARASMLLLLERIDPAKSLSPPPSGATLNHIHVFKHYCAMKLQELVSK